MRLVKRYEWMMKAGPSWPSFVLYLNTGDQKQGAVFAGALRDLVSRGRAAGIIVLAATRRPGSDVIPTFVRDLFAFRWAFRCSTPHA